MKAGLKRRLRLAVGGVALVIGLALISVGLLSLLGGGSSQGGPLPQTVASQPRVSVETPDRLLAEAATPTPEPTPEPTEEPTPPLLVADVPYRMVIEKIGVDAPVVEMGMDSRGVPYVPLNAYDVAWYNFSSPPGAGSNAVFAGHVYWQGAAVFAKLKELEPGDIVRLVAEDGREYVYSVVANFTVDPDNPDSLQVMGPTAKDTITLITCDGTWVSDPSAQFGGYYTDRLIVQAELVSTSVVAASQGPSGG